ncbi:MAG TPA: hypothetical protein DF613_08135 [Lachnospiraceae bacterium]|nr:hypothetical protein [Lachnospiraceae bacterium]
MLMNAKRNRMIAFLLAILMAFSIIYVDAPIVEAAGKTALAKTSGSVVIGGTQTVKVKNAPKGASITYKSSKKSVAKVTGKGKVTGLKAGTAKITVTVKKGKSKKNLIYKITVKKPKLSKNSFTVGVGKSVVLAVKNKPGKSVKAKYKWTSSNKSVAAVTSKGKVTGKKEGTATVKVKVSVGKKLSYTLSCKVKVGAGQARKIYTVVFDSNGGSSVPSQSVEEGQAVQRPGDPTKSGYRFDGWYSDQALKSAYDFSEKVTADRTLYAKWEAVQARKYTVTFNSNGGSSVSPQNVEEGQAVQRPGDPTRSGYLFGGWYSDPALQYAYDFSAKVAADLILYAKWEAVPPSVYTVTFISNGGSEIPAQAVEIGGRAVKPEDPVRKDYTFVGWYADEEKKTEFDFGSTIAADTLLYAKWQLNEDADFDLGKVEELVGDGVIEVAQNNDTSIRFIDGGFSNKKIQNQDDALYVLERVSPVLTGSGENVADTVGSVEVTTEDDGTGIRESYYLFTAEVGGIPVEGSDIILVAGENHTPEGLVNSYKEGIKDIDTQPDETVENNVESIIKEDILAQAREQWGTGISMEDLNSLAFEKKLVIYAMGDEEPMLAWRVSVREDTSASEGSTIEELGGELSSDDVLSFFCVNYYIAANGVDGGEIITRISSAQGAWEASMSSGEDIKGVSREFSCQRDDKKFRMVDPVRKISTYQTLFTSSGLFGLGKQTAVVPGQLVEKGLLGWNKKAVSAHYFMAKVWDYYRQNLGRVSYDGHGADIRLSVEYVPNSSNAFTWLVEAFGDDNACWSPYYRQFMFYNTGGNEAALDICGHEFTHAVINTIVGGQDLSRTLTYQGESGALNESYADILGCLIEGKTGNGRWLISEDGTNGAVRDMSDPSRYGQPEHYDDREQGTDDDGGVHSNSGIFNFAAYKMMTDKRTSGISDVTWARLYIRSLRKLATDATFEDAALAVLSTAKTLGFTYEQREAIRDAYKEVGIIKEEAIRIVLQWGAAPDDLDAHLVGPTVDRKEKFHVYFDEPEYEHPDENAKEKYVADLDFDSAEGNGKEIISIRALTPGDYYYYVHNYSDRESTYSTELSASRATVKVYRGNSNEFLKTVDGTDASFNVDTSKDATLWSVLHIQIDEERNIRITPVHAYGYHSDEDTVGQ